MDALFYPFCRKPLEQNNRELLDHVQIADLSVKRIHFCREMNLKQEDSWYMRCVAFAVFAGGLGFAFSLGC